MNFSLQNVLDHFGLSGRPFTLVPDPGFFFMSEQHRYAQASLAYGIMSRAPITMLTGDIGAGKTLILRDLLLNQQDEDITVGLVANAAPADRVEMLRLVLYALGEDVPETDSYAKLYAQLEAFLVDRYRAGQRVVLIFDEAQNLDRDSLEHLRMLTNINYGEHELVQLVLIGQPDLRDMIARPDLRQLAQRISASAYISPLSKDEIGAYIEYRLQVVGREDPLFSSDTYEMIYDHTGGVPRLINQLCDYGLLYAFGGNEQIVTCETLASVVEDNFLMSGERAVPLRALP
ncbi:ExeA family protein [Celeribacter neptunius]|nr:AAA family ATPase [Celeribacter neptunius]